MKLFINHWEFEVNAQNKVFKANAAHSERQAKKLTNRRIKKLFFSKNYLISHLIEWIWYLKFQITSILYTNRNKKCLRPFLYLIFWVVRSFPNLSTLMNYFSRDPIIEVSNKSKRLSWFMTSNNKNCIILYLKCLSFYLYKYIFKQWLYNRDAFHGQHQKDRIKSGLF